MGIRSVLVVGGSDPSSGAGIQVDTLVLRDLGLFVFSVSTAVTAQNSRGVADVTVLDPAVVRAQVNQVVSDYEIHAVKIGMVGHPESCRALADELSVVDAPIVLDPVLRSTSGTELFAEAGLETLTSILLPLVTIVTPNLPEAEALTGCTVDEAGDTDECLSALLAFGARWVLLTGGHTSGGPAVDILSDGRRRHSYSAERLDVNMRGTGCILASNIAGYLVLGHDVPESVRLAKKDVTRRIKTAIRLGRGRPQTLAKMDG